jgi:hypothetical protein
MKCLICNNHFIEKRKFLELFKVERDLLICEKCYKKYPINLNLEFIELEKYHAVVISMFKRYYRINYNAYIYEYSKVLRQYFKRNGYFTLFFDKIDFDDHTLFMLDLISKLNDKNLIIVVFNTVE